MIVTTNRVTGVVTALERRAWHPATVGASVSETHGGLAAFLRKHMPSAVNPLEPTTRIRLSGELRAEHLDQLEAEVKRAGPPTALDLEEVHLVDIEAVRFLNVCVADGVSVLHCSRYIREWMLRKRGPKERNDTRKKGQAPLKDEDGKNV